MFHRTYLDVKIYCSSEIPVWNWVFYILCSKPSLGCAWTSKGKLKNKRRTHGKYIILDSLVHGLTLFQNGMVLPRLVKTLSLSTLQTITHTVLPSRKTLYASLHPDPHHPLRLSCWGPWPSWCILRPDYNMFSSEPAIQWCWDLSNHQVDPSHTPLFKTLLQVPLGDCP